MCTGDLVPDDNQLGMPETTLSTRNPLGWNSTIEIQDSKVTVKLEGPVDRTIIDSDVIRDLATREAQYHAELWLSVFNFVEGASHSTRISRIIDSTGRKRKVSPKPKFISGGEDLQFQNREALARKCWLTVNKPTSTLKWPCLITEQP